MQNNYNDLEIEDKLLNNSLLFSSIRRNKTPEEKNKKIKKYLDRGADINATDANHKNNTPLHVAVMKEEPEVVSFLLERGALVNKKNSDNQTTLDIALLSDKSTSKREDIVTILEVFNDNKFKRSCSQQDLDPNLTTKAHPKSSNIIEDQKDLQPVACEVANETQSYNITNDDTSVENKNIVQNKPKKEKKKNAKGIKIFQYQKRTGTSGLSGQLYETKLLSLILFRALYVLEIKTFLIATNVESMGAFDDIIFRFYSNKGNKPKIMFVQAKHRDNPAKDKFTVEEIMKVNGDFSLHKYLESYIKISQMFVPENSDDMFRGEFKNMDCEFVIYTSAFEKFSKMKTVEQTEGKHFINTSKGKVFRFDYDDKDVELLVKTVAKSRAVLLAKRFAKFIFKDNYSYMMTDDLIKTYHVFLARYILDVEVKDGQSQNNFHYAKFRESFFSSNDNLLLAFKATICKEVILLKKNISPEKLDEVENILMSLTFKVPVIFGNLKFCFTGSEQKKEKKLEYLCSKFKQLFENANDTVNNIVMNVDDNMVGPNEILQSTDLESYRLGGLVGNLLVFDNVSKTLKFNCDVDTLSEDILKLFEKLKSDVYIGIDVSKCRFDINVYRFPRLSLIHDEYDKNLINDFLGKLTFYTNQATEDEVEKILKKEIDKYFVGSISRQSDALFKVKEDAIFLKVHDRVQKWWKQPINAPYLTESCEYFFEAEKDILTSPLLSILNFTYTKTIKNALPELKFTDTALELLQLDGFFAGPERIVSIITEETALSSIKIIQYFKERNFSDYTFIDLDYVGVGNYFVDVKSEIQKSKINTLIVVCKDVNAEMHLLINHFEGKVIVISNQDLAHQMNGTVAEVIVTRVDSQTGFKDLADTMHTMLLQDRYIVFQGKEVPLGILFEDKSYHLINSKVLYMIINNEKIKVGNFFNTPAYDEILDFYISERVCRYITLDPNALAIDKLNILKYNELKNDSSADIVLIADNEEDFAEFINAHDNCNVHWFSFSDGKCLVWQKSRGSLLNILKHIRRGTDNSCTLHPVTLTDLTEKVVIISGEPGMGKSTLLTHLAINTKHKNPALWISKINLLENANELRRIKENKHNIDFKDAVQLLFRIIGFEAYKERKVDFEIIIDQVSVIGDDINLNKNNVALNLIGSNLFEIELFIHCYNNDRVVLLFDGFDEICPDYENEFLQLVNILKNSKVTHLWITSRLYNVLHQLENTLGTFSFTIQPLSRHDQDRFLEKIESSKVGLQLNLQFRIRKLIGEDVNEVLSIPLHLYLLSVIFCEFFYELNSEEFSKTNLNQLYERFVDVKFSKIRFGEKKPGLCTNDPDIRTLIDKERTVFFHIHKIIAGYVIFGKMNELELLDNHDINEIRDFFERIKVGEEKTGIIQRIVQNKPMFVHYTFVEYFAIEFLCDKLKSFRGGTSLWMYLFNSFLQSEKEGLRRFFNAKLEYHTLMFNEVYNVDLNEMFNTLLLQNEKLVKLLFTALSQKYEHTAIFLLKCIKTVLNKNNLNDFINVVISMKVKERCILCLAVAKHANRAVRYIIETIKEFDVNRLNDLIMCADLPIRNPMLMAFMKYPGDPPFEMINVLLSNLSSPAIVGLFCTQFNNEVSMFSGKFIHIIACSLGTEWGIPFHKALGRLNKDQLMTIFSATDLNKKLAAHKAAQAQVFRFFDKLEIILEKSQFLQICMTLDASGQTPIHYFKYSEQTCGELEILLSKVYGTDANAKLSINYFIDKHRALVLQSSRGK